MRAIDTTRDPAQLSADIRNALARARARWERYHLDAYAGHILRGLYEAGASREVDVSALAGAEAGRSPLWASYADLGAELSGELNRVVVETFAEPGAFTPSAITNRLRSVARGVSRSRLENIADTESSVLVNAGRELWYATDDTGEDRYVLQHSHDHRMCVECEEADARIGEGVTLSQLREIVDDIARRRNGPGWVTRGYLIHPRCRAVLLRVSR